MCFKICKSVDKSNYAHTVWGTVTQRSTHIAVNSFTTIMAPIYFIRHTPRWNPSTSVVLNKNCLSSTNHTAEVDTSFFQCSNSFLLHISEASQLPHLSCAAVFNHTPHLHLQYSNFNHIRGTVLCYPLSLKLLIYHMTSIILKGHYQNGCHILTSIYKCIFPLNIEDSNSFFWYGHRSFPSPHVFLFFKHQCWLIPSFLCAMVLEKEKTWGRKLFLVAIKV